MGSLEMEFCRVRVSSSCVIVQAFFYTLLHVTASVFTYTRNKLGQLSVALWNEFKAKNIVDTKESKKHYLHFKLDNSKLSRPSLNHLCHSETLDVLTDFPPQVSESNARVTYILS
jgi:hypothetical protein